MLDIGQRDVGHVVAASSDEARMLLGSARRPYIAIALCFPSHLVFFISLEARLTASTICWYPVQRHKLPLIASRICSSLGSGFALSSACAAINIPGVQ